MFVAKIGGVPAHPANVQRLLHDEQQLVLVFPEGAKGDGEALQGPLQAAPLRPRRLRRGGDARRACRSSRSRSSARRRRCRRSPRSACSSASPACIYFPITPLFPHFGLLGASLPAGQVQAPLPRARARPTGSGRAAGDQGLVQDVADDIRARIQDELIDMLAHAPLGLDRDERRRRVLITGLSTYWGGRLAQALERDPDDRGDRRRRARRPDVRARPARSTSASAPSTRCSRGSSQAARDRHGDRHAADRRLGHWPARREAHENNVIGTMNILAACGGPDSPVRKVVFKSSAHYYGCERDDPAFFTEDDAPAAPAAHADRARHRRGRARRRRVRRAQPGRWS